MLAQRPTSSGSIERSPSFLPLALWVGIVTGYGELAVVAPALFGPDFARRSRDAVWMIPAFDGAIFMLIGILLVVIARRVRVTWLVAVGLLVGLGTFLVLVLVPKLHLLAALLLAGGIGTQVARLLRNRVAVATRVVRRSLPWLGASVAVVALVTVGWRVVRERWLVHTRPAAQAGTPNVLLLILDTVRAADLSLYGYARRTTPEIERFAEGGTVFDRAFAPSSWTLESHASMFTGRWALELETSPRHRLGEQWLTLTEALRSRGYATAAFVANKVFTGWESGLSQGFEHFEDYPVTLETASTSTAFQRLRSLADPFVNRLPVLWRLATPESEWKRSAEEINRTFLAWVDRAPRAPFFAFLNFLDAHEPYTPPQSFRSLFRMPILRPVALKSLGRQPLDIQLTPADMRPTQDMYDGSIAYLDSQVGALLRELQRRGVLENTLVIITSDHGEEFAEHRGLIEHGSSLYRLSLWVPLVVWFPGHVPAGRRVAAPVSLRNLAATILDLALPGTAPLPGRSFARFWTGMDMTPDTIVASVRQTDNLPTWFPVSQNDLFSIAFEGRRYIWADEDNTEELYDFDHDVLERWNMVESDSGKLVLPRYRAALAALGGVGPSQRFSER